MIDCDGTGQLVWNLECVALSAWFDCPRCGRRVEAIGNPLRLGRHDAPAIVPVRPAPADPAPTLGL